MRYGEVRTMRVARLQCGHGTLTSSADVFQQTLLEAATVTQGAGYRYFLIVSQQDESRRGALVSSIGNSLFVTPTRNETCLPRRGRRRRGSRRMAVE